MKYKTSEVTNSSSTCFVISAYATGYAMGLPDNDLFRWAERIWPEAVPTSFLSIGPNSLRVDMSIGYNDIEWPDNSGVVTVDLRKSTQRFGPILSDIRPVTQIVMQANGPEEIKAKSKITFNKLRDIFVQVCASCLGNVTEAELYYTQKPGAFTGDGWDGGDPMGSYAYTDECFQGESFMSKIICVRGRDGILKMEERQNGNTG